MNWHLSGRGTPRQSIFGTAHLSLFGRWSQILYEGPSLKKSKNAKNSVNNCPVSLVDVATTPLPAKVAGAAGANETEFSKERTRYES